MNMQYNIIAKSRTVCFLRNFENRWPKPSWSVDYNIMHLVKYDITYAHTCTLTIINKYTAHTYSYYLLYSIWNTNVHYLLEELTKIYIIRYLTCSVHVYLDLVYLIAYYYITFIYGYNTILNGHFVLVEHVTGFFFHDSWPLPPLSRKRFSVLLTALYYTIIVYTYT